jgi:hypothetical protein
MAFSTVMKQRSASLRWHCRWQRSPRRLVTLPYLALFMTLMRASPPLFLSCSGLYWYRIMVFFAIAWLPRTPTPALYILALQAGSALAALAPVFFSNR